MKKIFLLSIILFSSAIFAQNNPVESGLLFSVSPTKKVQFSPALLQAECYWGYLQFAGNQSYTVADDNKNIGVSNSGSYKWVDLLGWGTGSNLGQTSTSDSQYPNFVDWGTLPIGTYNPGFWESLSYEEWAYLLFERENAQNLIGFGVVNGRRGLIILPDGWRLPSGLTFVSANLSLRSSLSYINLQKNNYSDNSYSSGDTWSLMEGAGAVFLPENGHRDSKNFMYHYLDGVYRYDGYYWTSSSDDSSTAKMVFFNDSILEIRDFPRHYGCGVRLVRNKFLNSVESTVIWSGGKSVWTKGDGSRNNPYLIESPSHLAYLSDQVNVHGQTFFGKYFKQTANFDMDSLLWTPIGTPSSAFSGTYDGDNFTISNVSYRTNAQYTGLFGYAIGASFENLMVVQNTTLYVNGTTVEWNYGSIIGGAQNVTINNCHSKGSVHLDSRNTTYCGGIIGRADICIIENCTNETNIYAEADEYSVTNDLYAGGIISYVSTNAIINNCHNRAGITSYHVSQYNSHTATQAGGVIGYAKNVIIENCSNDSSILAWSKISSTSSSSGYAKYSYVTGGGIIASAVGNSEIKLCYNSGLVRDSLSGTGTTGSSDSYNRYYSHKAGGILGSGVGTIISNCYNTADVITTTSISGYNQTHSAAGIAVSSASIRNCYNIGNLKGLSTGSISVEASTNIANAYYLNTISCNLSNGIAKSASEMQSFSFPMMLAADTFAVDINNINQGYPIFNNNPKCYMQITATPVDGRVAGSVAGTGDFYTHTSKRISATPNYGYHFVRWSDGNTENPRNITLLGDTTLAAEFAKNSYSLTTSVSHAGRGITVGDTTALYLDQIAVSATAHYGYRFVRWSDGVTSSSRRVNLTKDTSLVATFDKATFTASVRAEKVDGKTAGQIQGTQGTYSYLDKPTFTASALYGYHFVEWSDGVITNPRQITITKDTTIYAQFDKNTYNARSAVNNSSYGTVQNEPTALYLGSVTYTAVASAHYHFVRWSDGNVSNPRNVTITSDTTLTAIFEKDRHSVASASVNGSVSGTGQYDYGTTITLTAIPNNHYHFDYWSDNGNTNATRQVVVERDTTYRAIFAVNRYTITSNSVNGTVSGAGTYDYGQMLTLEATPASHYHFVAWSDGNTENPRSLSLTSDITIDPIFAIDQHTVYAFAQNGSVIGTGSFDYGTVISLEARANAHYHFVEWEDDHSTNIIKQYTVVCDTTFMAKMEIDKHTITTLAQNGTVSGAGEYNYGQTITLSASADAHYHFVGWTDGVKTVTRQIAVSSDATYEALFELDQHFVSISALNGIVTGSGYFDYGTYVTLVATPDEGYVFDRWSDGYTDNPYTFFLENDVDLEAIFLPLADGIDNVTQSNGRAYCVQRTLYVESFGEEYRVFDSNGHLIYVGKEASIVLPTTGMYIVCMPGYNNKVCAW